MNRASGPTSGRRTHLLIADDDAQLRRHVSTYLRENGYRVTEARDGREMDDALEMAAIDLLILDNMLPKASGIELPRALRTVSTIPVVLTARGKATGCAAGLQRDDDDCLAKPFTSRELLARITARLRQAAHAPDRARQRRRSRHRFAGWTLDALRKELRNPDGVVVDLKTGEYDMLLAFVEAPQRVLSRDHLLDMSSSRFATRYARGIDVLISNLRKKLGPEELESIIKTVRGEGYMFAPSVARV